ncbi:tRNA lysidine(34) synthetase TilS [Pectinatus cerevisiiphilus]|uniref:tRNA(Ile)-lysidine synthase n=1 Tax=Pectinatus cerevisiiphilus TaxID=86956 RepID=A0A4R3KED6_9FIRM|nr:tRNA lysidine(34) synthetase TilS [Pectinatus cerevisiiphilus]TCS81001.1 tRNA(Ile)-lysidine synthase [Pectinatus cerevisiiphilus]
MLAHVLKFSNHHKLFSNGDCILLACSGGPDSLCMTHIFMRLAEKCNLKIFVAHVEHGIRGQASIADAQFVEKFCRDNQLPFYLKEVNACAYADTHKISLETAARELRYDFLRETAHSLGCTAIAVAHHRGDQAETVLMHMLRGAGLDGLSGIQPKAHGIIRPLLDCTREDIENYCRLHALQPRRDATNGDTTYTRNRIRMDLLPYLRSYNSNIEETLCRTAFLLAEENDFLTTYAQTVYNKIVSKVKNRCAFLLAEFSLQHIAVKRKLIRAAIFDLCGTTKDIRNVHIDAIILLAAREKTGTSINLPHALKVLIEYHQLIISTEKEVTCINKAFPLNVPGSTQIPESGIIINAETAQTVESVKTKQICFIDKDKIAGSLKIRTRKNGDSFSPKGLTGHKKLKDLFIDNKIPRIDRDRIPILFDDIGIVWIAGIQQDNRCVPTTESKNLVKLSLNDTNSILTFTTQPH